MPAPPPTAPESPGPIARWEWLLLGGALLVALALRQVRPDLAYFSLHVDRDLYRATELLTGARIHLLGSEMQYGGRVFGPFVYFLYAVPLAIWRSPIAVGLFIGLVNTGLIAWLWSFGRPRFGPAAAAVSAWLFAAFPLEIAQLRFLWNPCFLPLMMMGFYYALARWAEGGRGWWLVLATAFASGAFQLHFSLLMALPGVALVMVAAGRRVPWRVVAACAALLFVLFLPFLWAEFRLRVDNVGTAVRAPEARASVLERHRPNPNALLNFRHMVGFDWNEEPARMGFAYLWPLREWARETMGPWYVPVWLIGALATVLHLGLWAAGIAVLARRAWWGHLARRAPTTDPVRRRGVMALLLLCWQFAPLPFLFFFNYHRMIGDLLFSIVPLRYYLITFPVGFLVAGVGYAALARRAGAMARLLPVVPGALVVIFTGFVAAHLVRMDRTGIAIPYLQYHSPTLGRLLELRDHLLGDLGLTADDYYDRVTTQNVLRAHAGEVTLDWLVTQDPRSVANPGLPAGRHVVIWAPEYPFADLTPPPPDQQQPHWPTHPDGTRQALLAEHQLGALRVLVFEGALPAGDEAFDPAAKRNYYYREERMRFLGRMKDEG